jgi:hypothetical protein
MRTRSGSLAAKDDLSFYLSDQDHPSFAKLFHLWQQILAGSVIDNPHIKLFFAGARFR